MYCMWRWISTMRYFFCVVYVIRDCLLCCSSVTQSPNSEPYACNDACALLYSNTWRVEAVVPSPTDKWGAVRIAGPLSQRSDFPIPRTAMEVSGFFLFTYAALADVLFAFCTCSRLHYTVAWTCVRVPKLRSIPLSFFVGSGAKKWGGYDQYCAVELMRRGAMLMSICLQIWRCDIARPNEVWGYYLFLLHSRRAEVVCVPDPLLTSSKASQNLFWKLLKEWRWGERWRE